MDEKEDLSALQNLLLVGAVMMVMATPFIGLGAVKLHDMWQIRSTLLFRWFRL